MNIFATDIDPVVSAKALDTKRVIKMVLESAQMLCTALHLNGASHLAQYKKTHANHPSNIWTRETRSNYEWLLAHFKALCDEYTLRCNKVHATSHLYGNLKIGSQHIPAGPLTTIANCAARKDLGIDCKHIPDVHLAYKIYLIQRWKLDARPPQWGNIIPNWYSSRINLRVTLKRLSI
jgi:hypothetical protein